MIPSLTLDDGVEIPQLGFGVFQVPPEDTRGVVEEALAAGYRHIDTAAAYRNEKGVGEAIAASGIAREELFVTTKLWNSAQGFDSTLEAFDQSLERLGVDQVDLYLIHWPAPAQDRFVDTWKAFERIHTEEGARSIGVSNFRIEDLERLLEETEAVPSVNQIELHPAFHQHQLRAWQDEKRIATEAWSPLGQGELLGEAPIVAIAEAHGKTPAQVIIRWHLQLGNIVFPKSVTPARIRENIDVFDFELSDDEMAAFEPLDTGRRFGPDPATFVAP
jgi:2,5-diketo-D-gluconate reductase A